MYLCSGIFNSTSIETVIENSEFRNNEATNGGALCSYGGNIKINNSLFDENEATNGGAISIVRGQITSEKNTFTNMGYI